MGRGGGERRTGPGAKFHSEQVGLHREPPLFQFVGGAGSKDSNHNSVATVLQIGQDPRQVVREESSLASR